MSIFTDIKYNKPRILIEYRLTHIQVDYSIYVSEVSACKLIELSETERSFLFKIMSGHDSSYKITSYIKSRRQPIAYKNEYTTMKRLQELNLIEEEGKFLGGAIYYKLTTCGLFYIFSNVATYSPRLLVKYQDSILLKTLLYPYFEIETIKSCTVRLYSAITHYLRTCCETTLYTLNIIKGTTRTEDFGRYSKVLESELEWCAKTLGFKMAIMYNESTILGTNPDVDNDNAKVAFYELESAMKTTLSKDDRFMRLLDLVQKEFGEGYKELIDFRRQQR